MELTVNGDDQQVPDGVSVRGLLAHLDLPDTGVAVAINDVVIPGSRWDDALSAYSRIDIVTAVQGG